MNFLSTFFSRCRLQAAAYGAAFVLSVPAAFCLLGTSAAHADAGHDHGDAASAAPATGDRSPRVVASSDLFEIVAIANDGALTIYLDRKDTNEPVTGAKLDVEAGSANGSPSANGTAAPQPDGTYRFEHAVLKESGTLAVSFTVAAGNDVDLLAGDLDLHHADDHGHAADGAARPWLRAAVYAGGAIALVVLALVLFVAARTARVRRAQSLAERRAQDPDSTDTNSDGASA